MTHERNFFVSFPFVRVLDSPHVRLVETFRREVDGCLGRTLHRQPERRH
jgi:hypothetical protein